ncbi:hypothetical protein HA466_0100930 [Hirschfeldia incana]|nr:hypothetical protein HA466_0100930 [Hirschfeldia incana]
MVLRQNKKNIKKRRKQRTRLLRKSLEGSPLQDTCRGIVHPLLSLLSFLLSPPLFLLSSPLLGDETRFFISSSPRLFIKPDVERRIIRRGDSQTERFSSTSIR